MSGLLSKFSLSSEILTILFVVKKHAEPKRKTILERKKYNSKITVIEAEIVS